MVSPLILVLCLSLPLLLLFFFKDLRTIKKASLPPGPRGLPIIGNLHQMNNLPLHLQLWELSKKYGPLFSLRLGLRQAIVVSSPELAKEVLKDHDLEFSGRPRLIGQQKLSYNGLDVAFSPYSNYWRDLRKIYVVHVLNSKRVSSFSPIREFEVKQVLQTIATNASSSKATDLNEMLTTLTSTIICRIAFGGKRYEDEEGKEWSSFHELLHEIETLWGTFFFTDYIPFLGWIDTLRGLHGRLQRTFVELDKFYQKVIDEHKDPNRKTTENEDITDVLLQLQKQRSLSVDLTNNHIKAVLMDMLVAATGTTAATVVWAMTALLKNPRVLKKAQEEIWNFRGKRDILEDDEIQNFSYLKAVIKETLRLFPPAPLLVPRETTEACIIDGYEIPSKTMLFVNVWSIQRDPTVWKDPEEFLPERFLDSTIDFRGQDFELIPFGSGRRMCAGLPMANASMHLILANLLNSFEWNLPEGMTKEDIDTEIVPGMAQHKKNPLYVVPKSRI